MHPLAARDEIDPAESAVLSEDTLCFPERAVNKNGHILYEARAPGKWSACDRRMGVRRPVQAPALDPKKTRLVHFLFSFRGKRIGPAYLKPAVIHCCVERPTFQSWIQEQHHGLIVRAQRWRALCTTHRRPHHRGTRGMAWPQGIFAQRSITPNQQQGWLSPLHERTRTPGLCKLLSIQRGRQGDLRYFITWAKERTAPILHGHRAPTMACLKCPNVRCKKPAQLIEARDGILHLMPRGALDRRRRSVAEGECQGSERYIENRKHAPRLQRQVNYISSF